MRLLTMVTRGIPVVRFFSLEYFQELAAHLSKDPEWLKGAAKISTRLMMTITDRNQSYLIEVANGPVTVREAKPDDPADFKFEGPYEQWSRLAREKKDIQTLVLQGKLKFRGPLAKFMPMQGTLVRIEAAARSIPVEL